MRFNVSKFLLEKLLRPSLLMVSTLLIMIPVVWVAAEKQGNAQNPAPTKKPFRYSLRWPSPDEKIPSYTILPKEGSMPLYRAPQDNNKLGPPQEVEVFETEHYLYRSPFHYRKVTIDHWSEFSEKGVEIFGDVGSIAIVEEKPIVSVTVVGSACSTPGYNILEWWADGEDLTNTRGQLIKRQMIEGLNRNFHFELHLHPKTYASYPVVSIANRPGLFEVVVRHILAVLRSRCAGFACPACLAADTCPARPLPST